MARLRSAHAAASSPPQAQRNTRHALTEKTNTTRAKPPVYANDGFTEDLVKEAKPLLGWQKKVSQNQDELVMAGGLGAASEKADGAPPVGMSTDKSARSHDTAKPNRRPPRVTRKLMHSEAQSKVMDGMKKRMDATAKKESAKEGKLVAAKRGKAAGVGETESEVQVPRSSAAGLTARNSLNSGLGLSEFSLSPSPPPPGRLSAIKGGRSSMFQPGSVLRPQNTPAAEVSTFALKHFKRRPRQPSMLQMVQQHAANFRPSTVNAPTNEDPSIYDVEQTDVEDEVEDDFAPDAEGTPIHLRQAKKKPASAVKTSASRGSRISTGNLKKRKSDDIESSSSALGALRTKRRKSQAAEIEEDTVHDLPDNVLPLVRSSIDYHASPQPHATSDVQVINSSSTPPTQPSSPGLRQKSIHPDIAIPSTEEQRNDVEYLSLNNLDNEDADYGHDLPNGTMAEPASTSPLLLDAVAAEFEAQIADPVTQPSPVRKKAKTKPVAKPLSTAALQTFLPKRRAHSKPRAKHTEYDISDTEDDDIDNPLGVGRVSAQRKSTPAKPKKNKVKTSRPSKSIAGRKSRAAATRKQLRTYGRAAAAPNKGNEIYESAAEEEEEEEEEEGESSSGLLPELSMYEATKSKELEEAKRKFAEIDMVDLEFEVISNEDHRSSSQLWR